MDCSEHGQNVIVKQMALFKLKGCSVGKLRSYPHNLKYCFLGYFPNDVFFYLGKR